MLTWIFAKAQSKGTLLALWYAVFGALARLAPVCVVPVMSCVSFCSGKGRGDTSHQLARNACGIKPIAAQAVLLGLVGTSLAVCWLLPPQLADPGEQYAGKMIMPVTRAHTHTHVCVCACMCERACAYACMRSELACGCV